MKRLLVILLLLATPALADSRAWTDAGGKHHSTAELADFQGGVAYLRKDDGNIVAVPLAKLSKADHEFIKSTVPAVKLITGRVVGITDGDTLTVLNGTEPTKIRLASIDAPERHQAYGNKSREALAKKVFQKNVRVEWREHDKYKRTVGQVFVDDRWVNKEMIQEGWAWHYRQYSKSEVLADAESDARTDKAGLWADSNPIAPWDFRHPPVAEAKPSDVAPNGLASTSEVQEETVYITKGGTRYHHSGCALLTGDSVAMPLGEAMLKHSPCLACYPGEVKVKRAPKPKLADDQPSGAPSPRASSSPRASTPPATVDRNPYGEQSTGETATGIPTYTGPRGGHYHYSQSGKKVYEKKK